MTVPRSAPGEDSDGSHQPRFRGATDRKHGRHALQCNKESTQGDAAEMLRLRAGAEEGMVKIGAADDSPLKLCEEWGCLKLERVIIYGGIYGGPATGRPDEAARVHHFTALRRGRLLVLGNRPLCEQWALPGVHIKRVPKFMHTYISEHPEFLFEEVELGEEDILGSVGGGLDLTKDWFVETRLEIAAHCVGAATRATQVANDYAAERQFGRPVREFQAIEFMLAIWQSRSWLQSLWSIGSPGRYRISQTANGHTPMRAR
jgi:hypothetical protein